MRIHVPIAAAADFQAAHTALSICRALPLGLNELNLLTSLPVVLTIFIEAKVSELPNFEQIVLDVLHTARRTIFDQVVHDVERLEDPAVFFGFAAEFRPQMLHDHVVVLPVVRVVCKQLQLCV